MDPRIVYTDVKTFQREITDKFLQELSAEKALLEAVRSLLDCMLHKYPKARIYASGGIVRDLAVCRLGGPVFRFHDLDLVAEGIRQGELEIVLEELVRDSIRVEAINQVGKSFAVWKIKVAGHPDPIDLALARTEGSFGTHHRDFDVSTEGVTIEEDSMRRDFKMNALYLELLPLSESKITGRLLDFHGGLDSLFAQRIECVGDPWKRFEEDPLRLLRAIRFRARLPGFEIGEGTSVAMIELVPKLLKTISKERIAEEVFKALAADPEKALNDFKRYGVFEESFPDIQRLDEACFERTGRRIRSLLGQRNGSVSPPLLFAAFLFEIGLRQAESTLRRHLAATRINSRHFFAAGVDSIARGSRLHSTKAITQLCSDTLCLIHFDLLENAGAATEGIFGRYDDPGALVALYRANQLVCGVEPIDFIAMLKSHRPVSVNFNRLLQSLGIPSGPHLQELKIGLRQLEIDGEIQSEQDGRTYLNKLYMEDIHLIREHVSKMAKIAATMTPERGLPTKLREEIRWLLFTRPIRLISAYRESEVLAHIFPELAEAEAVSEATRHHFAESFLNDAILGLSLLLQEVPSPMPVHILSLLFLDIGKTKTKRHQTDGTITYYNHASVGAEMAQAICQRLGVEQSITRDVSFIIRNHSHFLHPRGAGARIRKLLKTEDESLISDLLLIFRIDQMSKMKICNGKRTDEGQLDTWAYIQEHLEEWRAEALEKKSLRSVLRGTLISGRDLMMDHPAWGIGLPQGRDLGKLKRKLIELQEEGAVKTREEAIRYVGPRIVLHHLASQPAPYLETLHRRRLLEAILPELAALAGLDQTSPYHTEDAFTHTLNVIRTLPGTASRECVLAAVFHDIGKAGTASFDEKKGVYHFYGHEEESALLFQGTCQRFGWGSEDFEINKTTWLIKNHLLPKVEWEKARDPKKTVEKLFFRGKGRESLRPDYRKELMALRFADILGAVTEDAVIRQAALDGYHLFEKLIHEVEKDLRTREENERFETRVKASWNGKSVLRHFQVEGREIARLLHLGQDYVRNRFAEDAGDVSEEEVRDFLKSR